MAITLRARTSRIWSSLTLSAAFLLLAACSTQRHLAKNEAAVANDLSSFAIDAQLALQARDTQKLLGLCSQEETLLKSALDAETAADDRGPDSVLERVLDVWPNGFTCAASTALTEGNERAYLDAAMEFAVKYEAFKHVDLNTGEVRT